MKYQFIISSIMSFLLLLSSQTSMATEQKTLQEMLPKDCHFSGEFQQKKQIKSLPVPLNSAGVFSYSCDYGLIWATQSPIQEALVFTKENLHFLVPDNITVENLEGVQHDFIAKLLLGLLSGDTGFIEKEFDISETPQSDSLLLKPKSTFVKRAINSVLLKKQPEGKSLSIKITDKNKQSTQIITKQSSQYANKDEFKQHCIREFNDTCDLLLDPERISNEGN